jgi:hypothetical protein
MTAAENGYFDILKWAHEHGCPWNYHTCEAAAVNSNIEMLDWASKNGCTFYPMLHSAVENSNVAVLNWLYQHVSFDSYFDNLSRNPEFRKFKPGYLVHPI